MSVVYRVRLSHDLDEQLAGICETSRLPVSAAIRRCVEHVLHDPTAWHIFAPPFTQADSRSREQQQAYVDYEQAMERFDMATVAATIVRDSGRG